ncbi:MAG: energy transducer TonB, partial [Bacteroidota bacterium]
KNHPDYLAWGEIDPTARTLTYSIHHKDNKPDFKYFEMDFKRPDGLEFKILMNVPPFGDWEKTEVEELSDIKDVEVPYAVIDQVPTLDKCTELSGGERKKCTSMEIAKFVNKNFNRDIANQHGLVGSQSISVFFKIGKDGYLKDVGARAPHPALEVEAKRVVNLLPKFIPGVHKGETVNVPYSLPILFEIRE